MVNAQLKKKAMIEKRGMRKATKQKYLDCINEIHLALNYNERANLQEICKQHFVSKAIPSHLKKLQIIRVTLFGHKWIDEKYSKSEIIDMMYEQNRLQNIKSTERKIKALNKQLTIEPIQTTEIELKDWTEKINEQKTIETTIPIQQTIEKKGFELKLFGLTIIKINR